MPLASLMRKDRNAFGSIIPVDRTTALPPGMAAPHQRALMGRRQLEPMYHFLVNIRMPLDLSKRTYQHPAQRTQLLNFPYHGLEPDS